MRRHMLAVVVGVFAVSVSATIFVPTTALAQDTATVQGFVTDRISGGPIAGATIQFEEFAAGIVTTTTSDAAGSYAQLLPTGVYVITVGAYGYESLVFVLDVESDTVFNPRLVPLPDSDGDGIPDDQDVEGIEQAVADLPASAFAPSRSSGGNRTAINSRLEDIEGQIAVGDTEDAIRLLRDLRRKVDGCLEPTGTTPQTDDWIVDCAAQIEIRSRIDHLITSLGR